MSTTTDHSESESVQSPKDDTIELHVRNVPRKVWLKARQAALESRVRFGQYVIRLLENAGTKTSEQVAPVNDQLAN